MCMKDFDIVCIAGGCMKQVCPDYFPFFALALVALVALVGMVALGVYALHRQARQEHINRRAYNKSRRIL